MPTSSQIYQERINTVIDYINENLDQSLSLNELAAKAHFSPFYFHRIFVAVIGEPVNSYTNRIRIEKSARLLRFSEKSISDIAFECGFSSASTLSRSFKKYFNLPPSKFRKTGNIENSKICKELHPMQEYLYDMSLEEKKEKFPIAIKKLPKRKIAYIRVTESYKEGVVINAFEKIILWAKNNDLYADGQFFGMSLDDPMVTPQDKYRYEVCLLLPDDFKIKESQEIQQMKLPELKYATTKISGDLKMVATAISYMHNNWLINSKYEPAHQYGLEYFLDKQNISNWSHFELELYIPVKPLINY